MADIRIKDLAVTAGSSASDDYLAVDGSTNGTRKLSAYSPTFGGNLTVNGTDVKVNNTTAYFYVDSGSSLTGMSLSRTNNILELLTANTARLTISAAGNTTLSGNLTVSGGSIVNGSSTSVFYFGTPSSNYLYYDGSSLFCRIGGSDRFTIPSGTGNVLIGTTTDGGQKLQVNGTAAISGALSIGNTVQTAVSVASTHKVTISIGGTTYYLLATNV